MRRDLFRAHGCTSSRMHVQQHDCCTCQQGYAATPLRRPFYAWKTTHHRLSLTLCTIRLPRSIAVASILGGLLSGRRGEALATAITMSRPGPQLFIGNKWRDARCVMGDVQEGWLSCLLLLPHCVSAVCRCYICVCLALQWAFARKVPNVTRSHGPLHLQVYTDVYMSVCARARLHTCLPSRR